jgi:enoyl-CoA hydratase
MSLNFETLQWKQEAGAGYLTINRPQVLNALNAQVLKELEQAVAYVRTSNLRALVIAGAGEKAFVAGADISQMSSLRPQEALEFARLGQKVTTMLETLPQLTIARVQGFALGGGCELAMACDVVIASKKARFGQPEVNLGLVPGFGGTQRLVRRVGLPVALDILCAGRNLSGEEAASLGLVSRCAEPEELDAAVEMVLKGIMKAGPLAIAETKRLTRSAYDCSLTAGLAAEASAFAAGFDGDEAKEGMKAFVEKRPASFTK